MEHDRHGTRTDRWMTDEHQNVICLADDVLFLFQFSNKIYCIKNVRKTKQNLFINTLRNIRSFIFYSVLFYPIALRGRHGTTDDLRNNFPYP